MRKLPLLLLILLSFVIDPYCASADEATVGLNRPLIEIVNRGKTCKSYNRGNEYHYRIGNFFHISIAAVGTASAGIHFMKSDSSQPIYASFGAGHGCIIVNRFKGQKEIPEFVFISPRNGVVYESWSDCGAAL
jgi:hypothetical protein